MPEQKPSEDLTAISPGATSARTLLADVASLTDQYGRFTAQPFARGFGTTIGNSLRRALLTSIEGAAITAVRIEGVLHEFATMPGVAEDVTDLILNLKQIPFRLHSTQPRTLLISKSSPGAVTAADIQGDSDVEILDTSVHIATLHEGGSLNVEMRLKHGRGYVPAERNSEESLALGYIPIDSVHTPIKKVSYTVAPVRTGEYTEESEQLTIEVWTDGSITPETAVADAAELIREQLLVFSDIEESIAHQAGLAKPFSYDLGLAESFDALVRQIQSVLSDHDSTKLSKKLDLSVDALPLSVRSYNILKNADIRTVRQLAQHTERELLAIKYFDNRSLLEIREILNSLGLDYGMKFDTVRPIAFGEWEATAVQMEGDPDARALSLDEVALPDEVKALLPAVRLEMHEEATARKYVTERYRSLVDRKYAASLSTAEAEELERLRSTLDAMDEPYYDAIIKRLRHLMEQKEVSWPTLSDHLEAQQ